MLSGSTSSSLGGQIDAVRLRDGADAFGIAQQDTVRDASVSADRGGAERARFVPFGQDDAAVGGARGFDEAVAETGGGISGSTGTSRRRSSGRMSTRSAMNLITRSMRRRRRVRCDGRDWRAASPW